VMDRLQRTGFLNHLSGEVYLTHYQAVAALAPDILALSKDSTPTR
jgi:sulfate permease, SulP family